MGKRDKLTTLKDKPTTIKFLWQAVYWVSYPFGILSFVLPIYGKELGGSALDIGGFFSAFSIIPMIVRPFLGRALDRWGRRPFLLVGLIGYLLSMVVFAFANPSYTLQSPVSFKDLEPHSYGYQPIPSWLTWLVRLDEDMNLASSMKQVIVEELSERQQVLSPR